MAVFDEHDQRYVITEQFGRTGKRVITLNERGEIGTDSDGADWLWLRAMWDHFGMKERPREWTEIPPADGIATIGK